MKTKIKTIVDYERSIALQSKLGALFIPKDNPRAAIYRLSVALPHKISYASPEKDYIDLNAFVGSFMHVHRVEFDYEGRIGFTLQPGD